jgi:hypothetical protein
MKHSEKIVSASAALAALTTLACCLPLGFAAAAATGGLGAVVVGYRPWLLGASVMLLALGAVQMINGRRSCDRRTPASLLILAIATGVVALIFLFPQIVAGLVADWMP